jgi:WD40 repeat protein
MVLDCCWAPDGSFFATASRDKTVKLWKQNSNNEWTAVGVIKMTESVTAADLTSTSTGPLLAVGTESGSVSVFTVELKGDTLDTKLVHEIDPR